MEDVLRMIVESLIDKESEYTLEKEESDTSVTFKIILPNDQVGKVIGKHGAVAKSIRLLMNAGDFEENKKVFVKINSEDDE